MQRTLFPRSNKVFYILAAFCWMLFGIAQAHAQTTWNLVWSDEFNGPANSAPNPNTWAYDTGGGGWGNGELEIYCSPFSGTAPCDPNNSNIYEDGNGNLVIKAINNNGKWTSGRMKTQGLEAFQYGRIEARIKMQVGDGFWPAFWMLGNDIGSVGWPTSGEQDIMEWVQSFGPSTTSSHIHGPGYSGAHGIGTNFTFPNGGRIDDGNYHTYGEIWTPNQIQFYRDNPASPFLEITPADIPSGDQWVFKQPFFLLLNFAIGGGGFASTPDSSTPNPGTMLVDYVRVYSMAAIDGSSTSGPVSINAGGGASGSYVADADFSGGNTASRTAAVNTSNVTNPAPQAVYQSERNQPCTYTIPGLTPGGQYTVTLQFAEIYWTAAGKRQFNVTINGLQVLTNFDIFASAGGENIAIAKSFTATADSNGEIAIMFTTGAADQPKISGIEVVAGGNGSSLNGKNVIHAYYNTNFVVDDLNASTASGNIVDLNTANGKTAQTWSFNNTGVKPAGDYNLAVLGANCMEVAGSGTANGTGINIAPCNGQLSQSWNAVPSGSGYTMHPANAPGSCLNSPGSTTTPGTPLQIWQCTGASNQTWIIQ